MRRSAVIAGVLGAAVMHGAAFAMPAHLYVCSGYSCTFKTKLLISSSMQRRLGAIMNAGHRSPKDERAAIASAVRLFEQEATRAIGVRDRPKGEFNGARELGQMDCIDESTNTRQLLTLLEDMELLRHHDVMENASRGFLLDGRYPHATAVVAERGGGRWAVDSWYEPGGGRPDIMPLEAWRQRGVNGQR